MCNAIEMKNSGQLIERIFKEKLYYKPGQETAAYYHIKFSHNNKNKVKVVIDASLNPEVINKIIDHDKVKKMREKRKRLYKKKFLPNDTEENGDVYQIKPRKPHVDDNEPVRRKVLTKKKPKNDKEKEEIIADDFSKLERVPDDTKSSKKKNKEDKTNGVASTKPSAASSAVSKSEDADRKTDVIKSKDKINTKDSNNANRKNILEQKRNATKNHNILTQKNKLNKDEDNKIKKNVINYELSSKKNKLNSNELKNKYNNKKLKSKKDDDKNSLPAFARPCAQLKEINPNSEWKRRERPRYHGIHMHTKCFEHVELSEYCEKTPVFRRYISRAEQLNGGPMIDHMQNRESLYNSMCQDLMTLEKKQEKQDGVYKARSENCYQCQRNINEAEGVFFKTSYVDETRNLARAAYYRRTNYQQ